MSTMILDHKRLYYSFMAGAREVIAQKNALNAINVFPVIDGDTGSNLASMMHTILNESTLDDDATKTLESIADAALIGARGNSGIIFAQYLNGLVLALKNQNTIDITQYAQAINDAVPYAYQAISEPVEGTMITLMRQWGETIKNLMPFKKDFLEILHEAFETLKAHLQKTTETLKVLRDHKVVDAGAKGFVHFTEGFIRFLKTGETVAVQSEKVEKIKVTHADVHEETFRYCTEALISGKHLDPKTVREAVQGLGDSLVVAGNDNKLRLHIHTDKPQDIFFTLRTFGHIEDQKVDDMVKQHEIIHNRKYPIALVTDSIADLPQEYIDDYQIQVIPLNLIIEGSTYYDRLTITAEKFYKIMDEVKTYPTTSQPNLKQIENLFSFLSSHYEKIVAITVSSKMSGTYNVLKKAAESLEGDSEIEIIDSKQNSAAQGLLVKEASQMIKAGHSVSEIKEKIERVRGLTQILVSVQSLKYMVRLGRVGKVTGLIGKLANLKPVISIDADGEGMIYAKGLSIKSSDKRIRQAIEANKASIKRYVIVHADGLNRAKAYAESFKDILGFEPEYIMNISPIVAMNAGLGTVAVAFQKE